MKTESFCGLSARPCACSTSDTLMMLLSKGWVEGSLVYLLTFRCCVFLTEGVSYRVLGCSGTEHLVVLVRTWVVYWKLVKFLGKKNTYLTRIYALLCVMCRTLFQSNSFLFPEFLDCLAENKATVRSALFRLTGSRLDILRKLRW